MNKAFTKEPDGDTLEEDAPEETWPLPPGVKNYMTPAGERAIRAALAGATDKRRIRALERRLAEGEVVDPVAQPRERILFGARVTVRDADGVEQTYAIVGVDEADPRAGRVSWQSVVARALIGAKVGDIVTVRAPAGVRDLEIVSIAYS